jgi:hypothetical protein
MARDDPTPDAEGQDGAAFVSFDFEHIYPYKFWVSQWMEDEAYPQGFRYKILSVRDQRAQRFELVILLEERGGSKSEMARVSGPMGGVENVAADSRQFLEKRFGLDFDEQDYTAARTLEEFDALTVKHGWSMRQIDDDA